MQSIDTSSWREFKLDELFDSVSGDIDIKKDDINDNGINVVTAGETNNGILGKSDINAKIISENTITIDMFGNCVYRGEPYKMVTHARVFALICKYKEFNETIGLYISTLLNKLTSSFNYNNMCSWNKIKDLTIKLPFTELEEIDWNYMAERISELEAERISELEAERISELEAYLVATGLNNYILTDEDIEVLSVFRDKDNIISLDNRKGQVVINE